ncbi:MAG TPA: IS21 family transposase [Acidimicrobiales bacterium]|nr:IS21 family transposase [Acidimicrobiales bacterium]
MAFREVAVFEVREVLRLWLRGEGFRSIERFALVDRKTVRRYVAAGVEAGLVQEGGEEQLTDVLVGAVCERVRPHRPAGHGPAWAALVANHDQLKTWLVEEELTVVKAGELLARRGVVVPERTLHRYALEVLGVGRSARGVTVRVADGEPGGELQVDFGKMGMIVDPVTGRRRVCWALIFTACYSRHTFVWLTFRQTTKEVIAGCEAAWAFFGGVFAVVIPDNMKAIVDRSDPLAPRFNQAFIEYAQTRGFVVDPARVRTPTDKPRVERTVPFVRNSFFAGETFLDLDDAQRRVEQWCRVRAGMRTHGTIQCRPAELFALEEQPRLGPAPGDVYDLPVYSKPKVHRDHHIEVGKALYSVPGNLIGYRVEARADSRLVRVFSRGQLIKVHPRTRAGGRVTDPADLPAERTAYAMRDLEHLKRLAGEAGPAVGAYAAAVLEHPLPWTKMRQVYALLGLVKRWGPDRVEAACRRALDAEAIDVGLIGRMIDRATETATTNQPATPPAAPSKPARFARDPQHFTTRRNDPAAEPEATAGGVA